MATQWKRRMAIIQCHRCSPRESPVNVAELRVFLHGAAEQDFVAGSQRPAQRLLRSQVPAALHCSTKTELQRVSPAVQGPATHSAPGAAAGSHSWPAAQVLTTAQPVRSALHFSTVFLVQRRSLESHAAGLQRPSTSSHSPKFGQTVMSPHRNDSEQRSSDRSRRQRKLPGVSQVGDSHAPLPRAHVMTHEAGLPTATCASA
jgi:hypothetical protein